MHTHTGKEMNVSWSDDVIVVVVVFSAHIVLSKKNHFHCAYCRFCSKIKRIDLFTFSLANCGPLNAVRGRFSSLVLFSPAIFRGRRIRGPKYCETLAFSILQMIVCTSIEQHVNIDEIQAIIEQKFRNFPNKLH